MNEIQCAFIEEYGNYGFDFEQQGVSTHFIIVSILVKESNKEFLEQEVEKIRQKYFHSGEMISGEVEDHLRIQLLNELKDLPFTVYAYVIDKRKIREDSGITFKKTFIKYVNRLVYDDLYRTFDQLDLVMDEHGSKEFMDEFKNYVKTTSIPDLFNYSSFGFNQSQSNLLLQLANLFAATIAQGYDRTLFSEQYRSFYQIIKDKMIGIHLWPYDYKHFLYEYKSEKPDAKYDEVIIKQAVNLAYQYIDKNRKSDEEDEKIRIDFLKFLLFNLKENPDEYVFTQEILDNLNAIREIKINQHYFRSTIVSKLRDQGLLISSSNKGYKLPASLTDLYDFVNLSSLTIHPMIQRISKCRDQILVATNKEIDILDQKEYEYLKRIIEMEKLAVK
ncbi:DUF3800 domain-containing protein [Neobacillus ginsengisoli]|uniref:Biotin operon repressor n=1 Tax=Neobacillus ginsengisoli TaxID=904295 RepID=A0ABT9XV73_9BACI|nr:DUF3800 domain-containing protein [Neobacillus ginsengisoli]MDQ0199460.1 biotin operon repressor [Neobacillus ginsengisoli]